MLSYQICAYLAREFWLAFFSSGRDAYPASQGPGSLLPMQNLHSETPDWLDFCRVTALPETGNRSEAPAPQSLTYPATFPIEFAISASYCAWVISQW